MGIKEQLIFSEIDYDDVVKVRGNGYRICNNSKNQMKNHSIY